jgi:hypothetical protein
MRDSPKCKGKKWYEVPNPPGASNYPPGFLKPDLRVCAIFAMSTPDTDGFLWIPQGSNQSLIVASYGDLEKALGLIPPGSLDMLVLAGHAPNWWSSGKHCGIRFDKRLEGGASKPADEGNCDEKMPAAIAKLIQGRLSKDGILVVSSCRSGVNSLALQNLANLICRPVAAGTGDVYCVTPDNWDAGFDFDFEWMGGYSTGGYKVATPSPVKK